MSQRSLFIGLRFAVVVQTPQLSSGSCRDNICQLLSQIIYNIVKDEIETRCFKSFIERLFLYNRFSYLNKKIVKFRELHIE